MTHLIMGDGIEVEELETKTLRSILAQKQPPYLKRHFLEPMQEAAKLGGNALAVYLAILHRLDVTGQSSVTLSSTLLGKWGVENRTAKSRAIQRLEEAGLILVKRAQGRTIRVSVPDMGK
jgi:DNA-binding MarR family transcriptional regulator